MGLKRGSRPPGSGGLTDIRGIRVGHAVVPGRPSGCTVVVADGGAVCGVDVRGGAPGTRETDLLDPVNLVSSVHAVVLAGGSAFGLAAACGVMRFLEDSGVGFSLGGARVPIVPAAVLYDLGLGDPTIRPGEKEGYEAARAASGGPVAQGNVGAGAGATVGKLMGFGRAMKSGLGTAALRAQGGVIVGALVAVNAVGDVVDPHTGRVVAGARGARGGFVGSLKALQEGKAIVPASPGESTTIGVVATNVVLGKAEATKVAQMAHDGLARTLVPAHTPFDGDTLFALSLGRIRVARPDLLVGTLAAHAVALAVLRGVRAAASLPGLPAASKAVDRLWESL
jgi:L-aminopeptidase/D-esterase-like protein